MCEIIMDTMQYNENYLKMEQCDDFSGGGYA